MVLLAFGQGRKDHLALMMTLLTLVSVRAANQDPTPDIDAGPGGTYTQFFLDRHPLNGRTSPIWKFRLVTVSSQIPI